MWRQREKTESTRHGERPEAHPSAESWEGTNISCWDCQPPETGDTEFLLLNHSICCSVLWQPGKTNEIVIKMTGKKIFFIWCMSIGLIKILDSWYIVIGLWMASLNLFTYYFRVFIHLFWEREKESAEAGERQRERQREGVRERIPSRLRTANMKPSAGLGLTNREIMTWAEIKSQMLTQMSHPDAPIYLFKKNFF